MSKIKGVYLSKDEQDKRSLLKMSKIKESI